MAYTNKYFLVTILLGILLRMRKVLIFHPTIAPYRIDFFNSIVKSFDSKIFLSYRNLRSQKFDYSKIENCFNFNPNYLQKRWEIRGRVICKGYWHAIKEFQPDIVICSEFGYDLLASLAYKKLHQSNFKIISICDDSYDMVKNQNDFSKVHGILRSKLTPLIDDLILVSPQTRGWFQQHYGKGVYFPIIADDDRLRKKFQDAVPISNSLIEKNGLKGKKVFLFVGRLVWLKNVSLLINDFKKANIPDSILVIIGDGPQKPELEYQAKESKSHIIFTGRLEGEELYAWYNISSCFVLPSLREPFGAVTNEALLAGNKCIISEKAGSSCLIKPGYNGYIFNPDVDSDLQKQMETIYQELAPVSPLVAIRNSMMENTFDQYFIKIKELLNCI